MKLKTFVAKGLTLGIILNYLSVLSFANTEIPNRYETLEGEVITINNSQEGTLKNIEIFGNTVQDENNLEDIQSVGDLYVNEDGEPILDEQGRKQYKVNIVSSSSLNLSNDTSSQYKTSILLPSPLMKVGNVADRLYWDSEKNKYIIEKNILEDFIDGSEPIWMSLNSATGAEHPIFSIEKKDATPNHWSNIINSRFKSFSTNGIHDYKDRYGLSWGIAPSTWKRLVIRTEEPFFSIDDFRNFLKLNTFYIYYNSISPQLIETNITKQLKIPMYTYKTYIYAQTENGIKPTLKVTVDRLVQVAENSVANAVANSTSENIALARACVNLLPEGLYKDNLQAQLNNLFSFDMQLEREDLSSNLDLYIKCENMLLVSLDTNSITFEDFSGVEDMEKKSAVNITVNSSLPYQINAYLPTEIQNSDGLTVMDKTILNIKESNETLYKTFNNTNEKVVLKDNCIAGNNLVHSIDLMLKGGIAHEKDVYKTTIKFEVEQK